MFNEYLVHAKNSELNRKEANKIELKLEILWEQIFLKVYQISGRFGVEEKTKF